MTIHPFRELRQRHFPYCLDRLKDGRYILLNRRYKPLGVNSTDWVDYEDHPSACHLKITSRTAERLSYKSDPNTDRIYLYNDGCIPTDSKANMDAYLQRLGLLMSLQFSVD